MRLPLWFAALCAVPVAANDCLPGSVGCEWHPTFEFAIGYDDRNQGASAGGSAAGTWWALNADGDVLADERLDWSRVRGLQFAPADRPRHGLDAKRWDALLGGLSLQEGAPVAMAIREPLDDRTDRNRNRDRTRPRVAFRVGSDARIVRTRYESCSITGGGFESCIDGGPIWRIGPLVRDHAADVAPHRVAPPLSEYPIWLLLPALANLLAIGDTRNEREIRDEIRQELRDEVREELADEVREEVREELADEVREEVRGELIAELYDGGAACAACPRPLLLVPIKEGDDARLP